MASLLGIPRILLLLSINQVELVLGLLDAFLEEALDDFGGLLTAEFAHRWPSTDCALRSDLHGLTMSHVVAGKGLGHGYTDSSLDLTLRDFCHNVLVQLDFLA